MIAAKAMRFKCIWIVLCMLIVLLVSKNTYSSLRVLVSSRFHAEPGQKLSIDKLTIQETMCYTEKNASCAGRIYRALSMN